MTANAPSAETPATKIPAAALWLTAAGFIPFALFSLGSIAAPPMHQHKMEIALLLYGAVILSFLGGIHWGYEMARKSEGTDSPSFSRLGLSVLPSLAAWGSLALPQPYSAVGLAVSLILTLAYDIICVQQGYMLKWYPKLRVPVTLAVVASLLLPYAI